MGAVKYLILIGDGMADRPLKELGGKTPLEVAKTPNMDFIARHGTVGWVNNIPRGMPPGSDVAAMSIFGYDPRKYYSGRGPLEAASLGVKLKKGDVAFRCNLLTVKDGKMKDFTADHISTAEAHRIMKQLNQKLGGPKIKFYGGVSYRNLLIMSNDKCQMTNVCTTPPHDITGKQIKNYLPKGKDAELLIRLMNESEVILHQMKSKATLIWPWGQGTMPTMPSFKKKFGLRGAVITAVDLLKGLGKTLGMEVIRVPGATGYLDTNYKGKALKALKGLKRNDLVIVHVEAPDEAGHEGSIPKKIRAIEDFDRLVVGTVLNKCLMPNAECRIVVLPDHPTPIKVMTHTREDVPFVIYSTRGIKRQQKAIEEFNEKEAKKSKVKVAKGNELLVKLIRGKL